MATKTAVLNLLLFALLGVLISFPQGCYWSGKSQGNLRSGKSQGNLEFVRETWNFVESQGNLRTFIFHKWLQWSIAKSKNFGARIIFFNTFYSKFPFPIFTSISYLKHIHTCT